MSSAPTWRGSLPRYRSMKLKQQIVVICNASHSIQVSLDTQVLETAHLQRKQKQGSLANFRMDESS